VFVHLAIRGKEPVAGHTDHKEPRRSVAADIVYSVAGSGRIDAVAEAGVVGAEAETTMTGTAQDMLRVNAATTTKHPCDVASSTQAAWASKYTGQRFLRGHARGATVLSEPFFSCNGSYVEVVGWSSH
jgi:hypothetical protein